MPITDGEVKQIFSLCSRQMRTKDATLASVLSVRSIGPICQPLSFTPLPTFNKAGLRPGDA